MYQFFEDEILTELAIDTIILTQDITHQNTTFIFFRQNATWFQIYFDENVLYIVQVLEADFDHYLQDLDLKILAQFFINQLDKITLIFNAKTHTLNFKNTVMDLIFAIKNSKFQAFFHMKIGLSKNFSSIN